MIDASQLEAFARKVEAASADLKPYMGKTLQEVGEEFLTIVQGAIEGAGNVDTGNYSPRLRREALEMFGTLTLED